MFDILFVDDNENTRKLMKAVLKNEGFNLVCAASGPEGLSVIESKHIDLIVLDVMMPGMDGYEFTKLLRDSGNNTPILMVTAKQLFEEEYKGFIYGADDYMTKPVDEKELVFRIKALLRRSASVSSNVLTVGSTTLDYNSFTVEYNGEKQQLPKKEFMLLFKLLSAPGRIFTRIQIMDEIWGPESESVDTTINVHVTKLRKRFENNHDFTINAIRGVGYMAEVAANETKA